MITKDASRNICRITLEGKRTAYRFQYAGATWMYGPRADAADSQTLFIEPAAQPRFEMLLN
jgi:hypothetical protein